MSIISHNLRLCKHKKHMLLMLYVQSMSLYGYLVFLPNILLRKKLIIPVFRVQQSRGTHFFFVSLSNVCEPTFHRSNRPRPILLVNRSEKLLSHWPVLSVAGNRRNRFECLRFVNKTCSSRKCARQSKHDTL